MKQDAMLLALETEGGVITQRIQGVHLKKLESSGTGFPSEASRGRLALWVLYIWYQNSDFQNGKNELITACFLMCSTHVHPAHVPGYEAYLYANRSKM